ncbi:hypothetical protein LF1_15710 [Rubripirellula obstinata]|uniref:Peptidase MA-like domain-containing protein n=1 Tax=Rubripirellula obstinata TaxID=406547 RepID=A0A5B1CGI0_9BACT|nr:hypothetical protein [Rubripirellula obstinata]KAA1259045.1 hypothetical protein LF1_15710 [Rubripirellula obstinata]
MDARFFVASAAFAGLMLALICDANGAGFRTQNFIVQAPTPALAKSVGESAERYRDDLATYWLGKRLPAWPTPCPIRVIAGPTLAAQGVTTYNRAPVRDFQMEVVGTPERILDSVLPHEVTHTILATHFGRPLPRWADEGICTTVEHEAERSKHEAKLREFLSTRRGIAMNQLFLLTEYPNDVLPMYAQGYSVCRFLIAQKDARTFIAFLQDYMQHPSWTENIRKHYGYDSLAELQDYWLAWVSEGSGPVGKFAKVDAPSRIAQASAVEEIPAPAGNRVLPAPTELNEPARGTALASLADSSSSSDGWYQRKKQDTAVQRDDANGQLANGQLAIGQLSPRSATPAAPKRAPAITPMVPPSVRKSGRYSAAQAQPEMGMSRLNAPYQGSGRARY